ncbi:ATP-grasp domain-containing protein [Nocardioides sp. CER19]|uniref:ATP-grasp domain-containing protein n=1 Tax=Nocardioides sp. CER19 TaxID=3038538 RepID=UPI0024470B83|nr:ATP-grasp domain-containing protein [Nocardioides sp. CER19]MDH2414181.1 ATP-grasp domain-containing protein [Nocardioides sp. CER19]
MVIESERRAVVLFADLEPWESFLQFAAALRRRGVRVERVTTAERSLVRRLNDLLQRPVFHRTWAVLPRGSGGRALVEELLVRLGPEVRAVEAVDVLASALIGCAGVPRRTGSPEREGLLFDKLEMNGFAVGQGVPVPPAWPAESEHGLVPPFVVKPRLGSGGGGVELVEDAEAAARLRRVATTDPGRLMVQERVPGELVHVAGVARAGGVLVAACYRAVGSPYAAFGPSAEVVTLDDPETVASAAALLVGLEYTGAFCIDFVRSGEGRPLLIDVNARIFGSWAALQSAGLDLVGAYLEAWGMGEHTATGALPPGQRLHVLPPDMSLSGTSMAAAVGVQLHGLVAGTRELGVRWGVSLAARLVCAITLQMVRRGRSRASRPPRPRRRTVRATGRAAS